MKKIRSLICLVFLSTLLVGNVFAGDDSGNGFFSLFDNAINAVVSLVTRDGNCENRQCQTCKPTPDGGDGGCRPTR